MAQKNTYFVGCLLTASRNSLNKIQFAAIEGKNHKFTLYSRTKNFALPLNPKFMTKVGEYPSIDDCTKRISSAKSEMRTNGISVPGVECFVL